MGHILYIDAFSGISGDKTLGAFVDLGYPIEELRHELAKMPLRGYAITASTVQRNWMRGTKVDVVSEGEHGHRGRTEIHRIVGDGSLGDEVKQKALAAFDLILAEEARVHGISVEEVHLHEVGAVDALVDIVGASIASTALAFDRIVCSPVNVGSGSVRAAHGLLPVPAPATAEILKGVPILASGPTFELTTPTGAAIAKTFAHAFGPMPAMTLERIGYGAGTRDFDGFPNLLRLLSGADQSRGDDVVVELAANVDDCTPAVLAHALDLMMKAGALDVFFTPIQMKKGRPAVKVGALVSRSRLDAVTAVLFRETTTIGCRYHEVARLVLPRVIVSVDTPFGPVPLKISRHAGEVTSVSPEIEDAMRIAATAGVALKDVLEAAVAAFRAGGGKR